MGWDDIEWRDGVAHAVEVIDSEFVVATAASADVREYAPLSSLLERMRRAFDIEAAFVSEWVRGELVVRSHGERGEAHALQEAYGLRLLQAGAPAGRSFRFAAVPVVTGDGCCHGMLCCRCPGDDAHGRGAHDGALHSVARLIADWFSEAGTTAPA
jgi:hypothetical protein